MDPTHFDAIARALATQSRRQMAKTLTGGGVAALLAALGLGTDAESKKKKKKKGKKKKKKPNGCPNGCPPNHLCTGGTCVPACTSGRPCGRACCFNNEVCVDGQCVVPCNDGRPRCGGVCCGPAEVCNEGGACDDALSRNLIVNGDAEAGAASPNGETSVPIPGWTVTTGATTVVAYGNTTGGWPDPDDPGPPDRGQQLFTGGVASLSRATQTASVASFAGQIDAGQATYELSGYLGGFASQGDNARLTAHFLDADSDELDQDTIGPVTTAERNSQTALLFRSATGPVPVGTRQIRFVLEQNRAAGSSNDGYADNLSLILETT